MLVDLKRKGGCLRLVDVFSLGSSPTVEAENRAKRLQPKVNSVPLSINGIYKMPNKTRQKLYFTASFLFSRSEAGRAVLTEPKTRDWTNSQHVGVSRSTSS